MGNKKFKTLVKKYYLSRNGKKVKCNDYILGKISGIACVLFKEESNRYAIIRQYDDNNRAIGDILTHVTTQEQYDEFTKIVDDLYPELCIFDYKRVS